MDEGQSNGHATATNTFSTEGEAQEVAVDHRHGGVPAASSLQEWRGKVKKYEVWRDPGIEYWHRALAELGLDEQHDLEMVEETPGEAIPRGKYHDHDRVFERAWEIRRRDEEEGRKK